MTVTLKPIAPSEILNVFQHFKRYLYDSVEQAVGWNDEVQSKDFCDYYRSEWTHWVEYKGDVVGVVCIHPKKACSHIHLMIIFEPYQGTGISSIVMTFLKKKAVGEGGSLTLSSFKCNARAVAFYRRVGFIIVSEDKLFYDFRWKPEYDMAVP